MKIDTIMRYVKDRKGKRVGVLVAQETDKAVKIGWSLCHRKDKFSKESGISCAVTKYGMPIPPSLLQAMRDFRVQCFLYFKNATQIQQPVVTSHSRQARKISQPARNSGHRKGCPCCYCHAGEDKRVCACRELAKVASTCKEVRKELEVEWNGGQNG